MLLAVKTHAPKPCLTSNWLIALGVLLPGSLALKGSSMEGRGEGVGFASGAKHARQGEGGEWQPVAEYARQGLGVGYRTRECAHARVRWTQKESNHVEET